MELPVPQTLQQAVFCQRCTYIKSRQLFICRQCKKNFSLKVGTIFEGSPIPLDKWLLTMWLICNGKNGISSWEIARDIGVTQKTAWFMAHRIRTAMHCGSFEKMTGTVEADETFIGGKARNMHKGKRKVRGSGVVGKSVVMGLLDRHGEVRVRHIKGTKKRQIEAQVGLAPWRYPPARVVEAGILLPFFSLDDTRCRQRRTKTRSCLPAAEMLSSRIQDCSMSYLRVLSLSQARPIDHLLVAALRWLGACITFVGLPAVWPAAVTRWLVFGPAARPYWAALAALQVAALVLLAAYLRRIEQRETEFRQRLYFAAAWCLAHMLGWSFQASNLSEAGVVLGYLLTTVWIVGALLMAAGLSSMNSARWWLVSSGSLAVGIALIHSRELDGGGRAIVCWRLERTGDTAKAYAFCSTFAPATTAAFKTAAVSPHTAANPADDFPAFRGPTGTGRIDGLDLATDWHTTPPRPLWRQSIGSGWGGFAVADGLAYTQEQRGDDECVVCYQALTGQQRWLHADRVKFTSATVGDGPRATPAVCDGRVYTLGATGILNCLDARTGKRLWSVDVLDDTGAGNQYHGISSSPLVTNGLIVVSVGGPGHSLVAYDAISGTRTWQAGDDAAGYGSPLACKFTGQEQIVVLNTPGVAAHDIETGALLWSFSWTNDTQTNCSQPVPVGDDRLFVSTGYGKGCALLRTCRSADGWSVDSLWTSRTLRTKFSSAVVNGDYAFGLDEGILTCIALADGSRRWKAGRYGHGQVLLAGDILVVQCEDGQVVLVAAEAAAHRELGRYAALDGKTWNYPALAGRLLLVRNDQEAACFEVPMKRSEEVGPPSASPYNWTGREAHPPRVEPKVLVRTKR